MAAPVVVLAVGLALAGCVAPNERVWIGLMPRTAARRLMHCLLISVGFSYLGLALLAAPALVAPLPRSALAMACQRMLAGLEPAGLVGARLAAVLLLVSTCATLARARRTRRDRAALRVELPVGHHERRPGFDLVTLPGRTPVAYSLGGRRPQVVISQGLRDRVDEQGLAAVVAHEVAHLRAGHDRWFAGASLLETALWFVPWVRPATATLRFSLERWADEQATGTVSRGALRAAVLAAVDAAPLPSQTAALSQAGALVQRLAMLAEPPPGHLGDAASTRYGRLTTIVGPAAVAGCGVVAALSTLAHLCTF